jgi:hypothetical protein
MKFIAAKMWNFGCRTAADPAGLFALHAARAAQVSA